MHRQWQKPECFTEEATPRSWAPSDARWCRAFATRKEMVKFSPGCDGCARIPQLADGFNGAEWG